LNESPPKLSPIGLAMGWVAKITTVALEMVLPAALGAWADDRWGTKFLALLGLAVGVTVGIWHLVQMTKTQSQKPRSSGEQKVDP
jgi:hypothetical protein